MTSESLPKCKSVLAVSDENEVLKHKSQQFNNLVKDYSESIASLRTMSDRLTEIEKIPIPEYVRIDAKVVFKPHHDLNLLDFSHSLRMSNMPLSTKLKAITNSLFPTAHMLGKDLS